MNTNLSHEHRSAVELADEAGVKLMELRQGTPQASRWGKRATSSRISS